MSQVKGKGGWAELDKLLFLQLVQKSVLCWGNLSLQSLCATAWYQQQMKGGGYYFSPMAWPTAPSQELLLSSQLWPPGIRLEDTNWFLGAFYGGEPPPQIFTL